MGEVDAYRYALLYLHEVSGRIIGRHQRIFGSGGSGNGGNLSRELLFTDSIYGDCYLLPYAQFFYLRLFPSQGAMTTVYERFSRAISSAAVVLCMAASVLSRR